MMRTFYLLGAATLAVYLVMFAFSPRAKAHDHYTEWLQPGTNSSCCNERIETTIEGVTSVSGDCIETDAELRSGVWFAWYFPESRWVEVPDDRLVRKHPKTLGKASLCYNPYQKKVLCFAQPDTGG